ncbi:MAG: hypothetical protein A2Z04_04665 [Chloroflexi bacterium RBG_16_57_9]|nr:MAG: hypothetical protein A2Z04_04665 [Chloroflexi bacterium RBG_16_57_9]
MSTQVVLTLPDHLYHSAEHLAAGVQQPVQNMLTEVLATALEVWDRTEPPLEAWSDEQVLVLCNSQMAPRQSERLSELLDKLQAGTVTVDERRELWALARIYELGQLRKAEALAEAVWRGLRAPTC